MASHPIDYFVYGDSWGTEEGRNIFSEEQMIDRWLKIEAALAEVEAEMGIIPESAAKEIISCASVKNISLEIVRAEHLKTRHTLVPVIRALERVCKGGTGEYIHFGPTTQDIVDTGMIMALKTVFELVERDLLTIQKRLRNLALEHAETPMVGRTHGQHALPITFGFKAAVWLKELNRHYTRLIECKRRVLVGSLSGGVGSYASLGEVGREVERRTMAKLGLGVPDISWQSSRDRIAEAVLLMAMICSTLGKVAGEIYLLQKTDVGELAQGFMHGQVGSSTMPHKRNPAMAEALRSLSRLVRYRAAGILEAMEGEHERDVTTWRTEWAIVPEVSIYTLAILAMAQQLLQGLVVNCENMRANLDKTQGLIMSEKAMFVLADHLGKQTAHEVLYNASLAAVDKGEDLVTALKACPEVQKVLSDEAIRDLLDPTTYVGLCAQLAREAAKED